MHRRHFLQLTATGILTSSLAVSAADKPASSGRKRPLKKGFKFGSFRNPAGGVINLRESFALVRGAGFDGIEVRSALNQTEVLAARDATGLAIPSVSLATNWSRPLSDPNPAFREAGLEGLKQGLRDAKAYGASSVLLVPAVVSADVSYADAYTRSVAEIKKAVPLAESLGVAIAVENVWNQFLLSPLEAVAYVDSFKSPMVRWHFDVGNVVKDGWPEHWIRVLGPRIAKVHVKEYSRKLRDTKGPRAGFEIELMEGDSDWPAVMRALDEVKYDGWMITEQRSPPGLDTRAYLAHLSAKLDAIFTA